LWCKQAFQLFPSYLTPHFAARSISRVSFLLVKLPSGCILATSHDLANIASQWQKKVLTAAGNLPDSNMSSTTTSESKEAPAHESQLAQRPSQPERQLSDREKETLAAYEGHDADIPSNEGYVLDERGELKRKQSIALSQKGAKKSLETNGNAAKDVEKAGGDVSTEEDDSNIVWWDGPDDPANPLNFKPWMKILNITLVSAICFVTPLGSSMFAPGVPELMKEFKSDNVELASFVVSVYVLGFAVGPLFFAPLSEIYGRLPLYHICNFCFFACNIGCALAPSLNFLVGFRFLAGVFGSAPLTNGGGTIADLVTQEKKRKSYVRVCHGPYDWTYQ
jgi:hypothetical protein